MLVATVAPQAVVAPSPTPSSEAEIDVIGNRLKKIRLDLNVAGNRLISCRLAVSSGDALIDKEACKGATECLARGIHRVNPLLDCLNDYVVAAVKRDQIIHTKKNDAPN